MEIAMRSRPSEGIYADSWLLFGCFWSISLSVMFRWRPM
jgi:hypothetical protein